MHKVLIVTGPTASGKSALALDLACALDGTVINADSMQVYRDLPILTAQPDDADRARASHRLYGVLDGDDPCSAARWAGLAAAEIADAGAERRLPILTGGSGLYLTALLDGLSAIPAIPDPIRQAGDARLLAEGHAAFHAALAMRDPAGAARIRVGDSQRLVRAWSVLEATGRTLGEWQAIDAGGARAYDAFTLLLQPPRPALYAAIDARFSVMVARGALDEVGTLRARRLRPDRPILKAHGAPELMRHLAGEMTLEAAMARGAQITRNYAKRQTTWFKHQLHAENGKFAQLSESLCAEILPLIRQWRLTPFPPTDNRPPHD